jgi:hypothetical protein
MYEYIGILLGGRPFVHISRIKVNNLLGKSAGRASSFHELYPDICLTTEEKARKNLSQDSRRVPVGTMITNVKNRRYIR